MEVPIAFWQEKLKSFFPLQYSGNKHLLCFHDSYRSADLSHETLKSGEKQVRAGAGYLEIPVSGWNWKWTMLYFR
jgi:hypothetical protein